MYDNDEVESEFWSHVPDSRFDRVRQVFGIRLNDKPTERRVVRPVATRSHTEQIPVVAAPAVEKVRAASSLVDPLLRRTGVLCIVVALLVPIALSLRSESNQQRTANAAAPTPTLAVGAADTGVPADALATPVEAADPFANIDVNALPPAVPANPEPTTKRSKAASTAAAVAVAAPAAPAVAPATTAKVAAAKAATVTHTAPKAASCSKRYTVRSGDAWILIAQRAKVSLKALLAVNGATTSTALYPGRTVCLPKGAVTPRPATTQATPTTSKPSSGSTYTAPTKTYTKDQVRAIIRSVWPDSLEDEAIRIATRESNLIPTAKNFCCIGLFQIYWNVHRSWLSAAGITSSAMLKDPRVNAYAAYLMYQRSGGWRPWR